MKHIRLFLLAIILLTTASINALAQDDAISVETNLVTLNVSVTGRDGRYVRDLKREDFEVYDGKQKQEIEQFSNEDAPVYFGIVYDMRRTGDEQARNVLEALRRFSTQLGPKDAFFVTVINERGSLTTDFVPTGEHISRNIETGKPGSLYDAIIKASEKTRERRDAKQILLVLTDGQESSDRSSLREVRRHLRSVNMPVYTVSFTSAEKRLWNYREIYRGQQWRALDIYETDELNKAALDEISKTSGGQSFEKTIYNRLYLYTVFTKILTEVENQYVIGFYPAESDGKWHKLDVKIKIGNGRLNLSSRRGYQSPGQK